ncbi:MAG: hypothetical protein ACLU8S_09915 [Coprococcus phoceensis]
MKYIVIPELLDKIQIKDQTVIQLMQWEHKLGLRKNTGENVLTMSLH